MRRSRQSRQSLQLVGARHLFPHMPPLVSAITIEANLRKAH
jgi:hypothetical protein